MDEPQNVTEDSLDFSSATATAQANVDLPESAQNNPFHPLYDAHTPKEARITKGQVRAAFSQDPKGASLYQDRDISSPQRCVSLSRPGHQLT